MSELKHDWLSPAEQAIMDAATSASSDYGLVAVTSASLATLVALSPVAISMRDFIEIARLTDVGAKYGVGALHLVRLNEDQKDDLERSGVVFAACHADPTGEYWGNILLDLAKMDAGEPDHLCNSESNAKQAVQFIAQGSWGATSADVQAMRTARALRSGEGA